MADKVVVVRLRAAVGEYTSGLARAGGSTVAFAGKMSTAAAMQDKAMAKSKQTLSKLGVASAIAGKLMIAGVGGAMVVSAKAAIDFETSLTGVAKTVEGTDSQIRAIGESMRALSLVVPLNVNELNKIAELGGQLGVGIPQLKDFTEVIAALGVTTNLSIEDAAQGIARLANVTATSTDDFDVLGSVIVELGNNFETTESEILTFGLRIAPVAQTVGVTADQVLGMSAALSSLGIAAERGGTAVQRVLVEIDRAAKDGGDQLQAFADITGLTTEQFRLLAEEDPAEAFVQTAEGLKRISDEGGNAFESLDRISITGVRAQQTYLAVANSTDEFRKALRMAAEEAADPDALWEEAARRYGTTASQIRLMSNSFNDLRIDMGEGLMGPLRTVVNTIAVLFQTIKDNRDVVVRIAQGFLFLGGVLVALGLARLIGTFLTFASSLFTAAGGARALGKALVGAQVAGGPITLIALALGTALAAIGISAGKAALELGALTTKAQTFRDVLDQTQDLTGAFEEALGADKIVDAAKALESAGLSADIFFAALEGGTQGLEDLREQIVGIQDSANLIDSIVADDFIAVEGFRDVESALKTLDEIIRLLSIDTETRASAMSLAWQSSSSSTVLSISNIQEAALRFAKNNPLASDSDFIKFMRGDIPHGGFQIAEEGVQRVAGAVDRGSMSWQAYVRAAEEGADFKFLEDAAKLADEFATGVTDALDEVRETLLGSFPAWDEYESVAITSLDKVFAAQTAYLTDLTAWADVQPGIMQIASNATRGYLDGLDMVTKGGLAKRWADNWDLMAEELTIFNSNLATAADETERVVAERVPRIVSSMADRLTEQMGGLVGALELPSDEQQTAAYKDGITTFMNEMPAWLKPLVKTELSTALDPTINGSDVRLYQLGQNTGQSFIDGLASSLRDAKLSLGVAVKEGITNPVVNTIKGPGPMSGWNIRSPSSVAAGLGKQFVEGLFVGMDDGMNQFSLPTQRIVPSLQAALGDARGSVGNMGTTNNRGGDTFNISGRELPEAIRLAGTLAGITRRMETKVGS